MSFKIEWKDSGQEPQEQPDPRYPFGIDLDVSAGAAKTCSSPLIYPAPRIGVFILECEECGLRVAVTTAGRRDDPRSVKVACLLQEDQSAETPPGPQPA